MAHEGSPIPGTSVQALSGATFRSLIKESLLEVLHENPQVLRPTADEQPSTQSSSGKCVICLRKAGPCTQPKG